jgi:hypothetical protein
MPSLLAQIAAATRSGNLQPVTKRGPVTVYDPRRAVQQAMAAPQQVAYRPPARTQSRVEDRAQRGNQPMDARSLIAAFSSTKEAQAQAQKQAQAAAPKPTSGPTGRSSPPAPTTASVNC